MMFTRFHTTWRVLIFVLTGCFWPCHHPLDTSETGPSNDGNYHKQNKYLTVLNYTKYIVWFNTSSGYHPGPTWQNAHCNECQNIVQEDNENAFGCNGLHCCKWYNRIYLDTDHQTHADLSVICGKFQLFFINYSQLNKRLMFTIFSVVSTIFFL